MDQILKIIVSNDTIENKAIFDIYINSEYMDSIPEVLETIKQGVLEDLAKKKGP